MGWSHRDSEVVSKLVLMTCVVEMDVVTIEKPTPVKAKNKETRTGVLLLVSRSGAVSTRGYVPARAGGLGWLLSC